MTGLRCWAINKAARIKADTAPAGLRTDSIGKNGERCVSKNNLHRYELLHLIIHVCSNMIAMRNLLTFYISASAELTRPMRVTCKTWSPVTFN